MACDRPDAGVPPDQSPSSDQASLSALSVSGGGLSPVFMPQTLAYSVTLGPATTQVQVTPTAASPAATILVDGTQVASGSASAPIGVGTGPTVVMVTVKEPGKIDRTYTIALMRAPTDYLKPSNTRRGFGFGHSVSLSGDTLAIGAHGESSSAAGVNGNQSDDSLTDAGAVYVFVRSGSGWTQQAYLKASNPGAGDLFGLRVSLSGDTLAVAAPQEDSSATGVNGSSADNGAQNSGAVYIFQRTGTTWAQQAYVKASNTGAGDDFGSSLSLSGDTLAVGARNEASSAIGVGGNQADNSLAQAGAVYVFQRSGATWAQQAYVKASNTGASDTFGTSLSLSGDTLAVGAFAEDSSATGINGSATDNGAVDSGAVYVFQRSGATWAQQAYVKASNTGANDGFGSSVALAGDTLVVGAPGESSSATGVGGNQASNGAAASGAAYVFLRTGTAWAQQAYLKASNTDIADLFGANVTVSGDLVAVSSPGESSSATNVGGNQADNSSISSGAVYLFRRTGTAWAQQVYLKSSVSRTTLSFGAHLSLAGDTLAIGATGDPSGATGANGDRSGNGAPGSGAVSVYR